MLGDDHVLIVESIKSVFANDFEIIGVASNGRELVSEAQRLNPDAVLLDISMPLLNGFEAAREITKLVPAAKLVFLTQTADRAYVRAAFELGASGYVLKQSLASELITAVRKVLAGGYYISPRLGIDFLELALSVQQNASEPSQGILSPRQREVLQLLAEGKSSQEIAGVLNVSVKTVEFHRVAIMQELRLRSTAELTRYAIEHGILVR